MRYNKRKDGGMLVIFEQDTKDYGEGAFCWRPAIYTHIFKSRKVSRYCFGFWSITFYKGLNLKEFHDYISSGQTEWRNK